MLHDTLWPPCNQAIGPELIGALKFQLYRSCKRALDLVITLVALLLLWPLLLTVALLIKLDSCGPVIFVQKRAGVRWCGSGLAGHWQVVTFQCYKFRTMVDGCDQKMHEAFIRAFAAGNVPEDGNLPYKLKNDPRVTRVGRFLRKSSLDELPQMFNILKGEMSWVGPRPVPLYEVAAYQPWHRERLNALPGLTGLWQVKGRSRVSFDEMVRLDIEYVRHPSLWIDLKLLLLTVPSVLAGRGAN
jgi:lipopolysaccharide/colanic/teichoic acid biosynthesis glycosyltransferase